MVFQRKLLSPVRGWRPSHIHKTWCLPVHADPDYIYLMKFMSPTMLADSFYHLSHSWPDNTIVFHKNQDSGVVGIPCMRLLHSLTFTSPSIQDRLLGWCKFSLPLVLAQSSAPRSSYLWGCPTAKVPQKDAFQSQQHSFLTSCFTFPPPRGFPGSPSHKLLALVPYLFLRSPPRDSGCSHAGREQHYSGRMRAVSGTPAMLYFLTCGGDLQFKYLLFIKWYICVFSCTFPYIYSTSQLKKYLFIFNY